MWTVVCVMVLLHTNHVDFRAMSRKRSKGKTLSRDQLSFFDAGLLVAKNTGVPTTLPVSNIKHGELLPPIPSQSKAPTGSVANLNMQDSYQDKPTVFESETYKEFQRGRSATQRLIGTTILLSCLLIGVDVYQISVQEVLNLRLLNLERNVFIGALGWCVLGFAIGTIYSALYTATKKAESGVLYQRVLKFHFLSDNLKQSFLFACLIIVLLTVFSVAWYEMYYFIIYLFQAVYCGNQPWCSIIIWGR